MTKQNLAPRLLVVGHFYRIRFRVRLTGQNQPLVEVLLFEHVVDLHGDFAAAQSAGTCTAVAFPAGEGRIQTLGQQHVEQFGAARPGNGVGFAVQLHHRGGGRFVTVAALVDRDRRERIRFQRLEHLDMHLLRRNFQRFQGKARRLHERARARR